MRKIIIINIISIFFAMFLPIQSFSLPRVSADSAAVVDIKSGQLIFQKDGFKKRPPASLTKMMTAILTVEYGNLSQYVIVTQKAAITPPSKLHIRVGEKILLDSLLKAALLKSANDACVAIAEHVGGDEEYFVHLMNLKGWAMCLTKTHFENTNGLPAKGHQSSAVDMAKIGVYCKRSSVLTDYVSKREATIIRHGKEQQIGSTNKLLWSYPGADGIKTGTTNAAGKCLASSASNDDEAFVSVVLHANDRYRDSVELLNYAFSNFKTQKIFDARQIITVNNKGKKIQGRLEQDVFYPVQNKQQIKSYILPYGLYKNVAKGEKCGLLAVVTPDSILWYDIYAIENKQILTKKQNIFDKLKNFM